MAKTKLTYEITCADCGLDFESPRGHTKYCSVCRLIRDLPYVADRLYNCFLCEEPFMPVDTHDKLCGTCIPPLHRNGTGTCAYCLAEGAPLVRPDVAVCKVCARDPENRSKLYRGLLKKQRSRREENMDAQAA